MCVCVFFQSDVIRKPQGQIELNSSCRIVRGEGAQTFQVSGKHLNLLHKRSRQRLEDVCSHTHTSRALLLHTREAAKNDIRCSVCLECFPGSSEPDSDLLRHDDAISVSLAQHFSHILPFFRWISWLRRRRPSIWPLIHPTSWRSGSESCRTSSKSRPAARSPWRAPWSPPWRAGLQRWGSRSRDGSSGASQHFER